MRILHILDHSLPRQSGYATRTLAVLKQQRALGWHTIHLTGPHQGQVDEAGANLDGWQFFRTAPIRSMWARLPLLRRLAAVYVIEQRLRKVVKLTRPDVLHAHPPLTNALAALRIGRRLGVPVVVEMRALWNDSAAGYGAGAIGALRRRADRAIEGYVARHAGAVAANSRGMRADMQARGVAPAKIMVVPEAVSIGKATREPGRDARLACRLGLGSGPVIGFFGSFEPHEGLDLLLAALPSLLRAHPKLQVLLAGSGSCQAQLAARARELQVAGSIVFAAPFARRRASAWYSVVDLMVYPRLAAPLAELVAPAMPLQAIAHGALVLASGVGCHRELIDHARSGILFAPGSATALAEAVLAVLAEPGCGEALRSAARAFAANQRSWPASVARYAPLYMKLIQRKRRR